MREKEQSAQGGGLCVKVTQTRDAKGSKVVKKHDRLLVSAGVPVVLEPKENRMIISAFKIEGNGIQAVVNVCQMAGIHVGVSLRKSGKLCIQIFNANVEAKIISQKMCLVGVLLFPGVAVS